MQAGAGFNEHWASHQVLQKTTASRSNNTELTLKRHNQGQGQPDG